jgi:hypothetical protein
MGANGRAKLSPPFSVFDNSRYVGYRRQAGRGDGALAPEASLDPGNAETVSVGAGRGRKLPRREVVGMYNFTRDDIDLEAIRARIARMSDTELLKYGQSAAWMAAHNDRATWRVQLEEARAEWRRRQAAALGTR